MRWKMASAHCFYLDFLERVYAVISSPLQAPEKVVDRELTATVWQFAEYAVEHDDLADYLAWTDCALAQIWEHHHFEGLSSTPAGRKTGPLLTLVAENELFPHWEKYASEEYKTHLMHNVEQHHAFARALDACWLYVRRCRALLPTNPDGSTNEKYNSMKPTPVPEPPATVVTVDPLEFGLDPSKPFDPQALRREMGKWVMPAVQHMAEEIGTLTPEYFESMGEKKYLEGEKILAVHLQASDPAWFLIQALCEYISEHCSSIITALKDQRKIQTG
jgi:hypothetical protein